MGFFHTFYLDNFNNKIRMKDTRDEEKGQNKSQRKSYLRTAMASIAITSSLHMASSKHHTKKQTPQSGTAHSLGSKQVTRHVTLDVEGQKGFNMAEHHGKSASYNEKSKNAKDEMEHGSDTGPCGPKFVDERWKNGTWDLNMFVQDGKIDWDGVIVAGTASLFLCDVHKE